MAVVNLPTQLTNMLNSLPLLSNEPLVATWRSLLTNSKKLGSSPGHSVATATSNGDASNAIDDCSSSADSSTPVGVTATGGRRLNALQGKTFKARNARLEVLLVTSAALKVQV